MKKTTCILLLLAASFSVLSGCSSTSGKTETSEEWRAKLKKAYQESHQEAFSDTVGKVQLAGIWQIKDQQSTFSSDKLLREVRRTDTAKVSGLKVLQVVASTVALVNGVPVAGVSGFSKEQLRGQTVEGVGNTTLDVLRQPVGKWLSGYKDAEGKFFYLEPKKFFLIYDRLSDDAYHLEQSVSLGVNRLGRESLYLGSPEFECYKKSASKPLEQWRADNYAAVQAESAKLMQSCLADWQQNQSLRELLAVKPSEGVGKAATMPTKP